MTDVILIKQPSESRLYDIDFTSLLATDDTITAWTSTTATPTGLTIADAAISSPLIQVRISSGAHGVLYKISSIVTTTGGDTLETDSFLRVID